MVVTAMIPLTPDEEEIIRRAQMSMYESYPLLTRDNTAASKIAGLRFVIGSWRTSSLRSKSTAPTQNDYVLLLCRMQHMYPDQGNLFVVTNRFPTAIFQTDLYRTLISS